MALSRSMAEETSEPIGIPPKKMAIIGAGMFVVPGVLFGGYLALQSSQKSEVTGTIALGADALQVDRCESGLLSEDAPKSQVRFHGVDLFNATDPSTRVRVFEDQERGMLISIRKAGEAPETVERDKCDTYDVQLKESGAMILRHWGLEGKLKLECPELQADVTFASCYDGS